MSVPKDLDFDRPSCIYNSKYDIVVPERLRNIRNYYLPDHDGTKGGFANEAIAKMAECVNIPIIASGGAGNMEDFYNAFTFGKADAALAASIFHYGEVEIPELKAFLKDKKIPIRL